MRTQGDDTGKDPSLVYTQMVKPSIFRIRHGILCVLGLSFIGIGIGLLISWFQIFKYILYKQLVLTPESETFRIWKDTPVPISMNFYLFNWTNPNEIKGEKPHLVELGPYCFREIDQKSGIIWNDNGTVTFKRIRKWYFDEENSSGSLDDLVTTLNPVALSAAKTVKYWSSLMRNSVSLAISTSKQKLHVTHSVGDLLFHGYNDPLLDIAKNLPSFAGVDIPYDKFGWFYLRNGSDAFEGIYNMDTGVKNISEFGKLHNWNYDNSTYFYEDECGLVKGSAGEIFPPDLSNTDQIEMFSADLCRSVALRFQEEVTMFGVRARKYVGGKDIVDNGTLDSKNECFCDGECVPSGVINVTTCRYGAPGFISFPHFHLADPFYSEQVEGMHPDPSKHSLYIMLEPTTGIPIDVAARFQINLLLSPIESIKLYKDAPQIFFPMMWFEQRATITDELCNHLKLALSLPNIGIIISSILLMIGLLLMGVYFYFIYKTYVQRTQEVNGENIKMFTSTAHPLIIPVKRDNIDMETNPELVPCVK